MKKSRRIRVKNDTLIFRDGLRLQLQRTLRIPDSGKHYPLPPGLGPFPVRSVDDYASRVPEEWLQHGGVFVPMYQREALWLSFQSQQWKPRAVKVGVGKVCAITGKPWSEELHAYKQDYIVTPPQPWLDGIAAGKGMIKQFIAMPLGMGYTVEGQVTGEEKFGGIQIKVFEPHAGRFPDQESTRDRFRSEAECDAFGAVQECCAAPSAPMMKKSSQRSKAGEMGLAAGGRMKQKVYPDPYGIETWDEDNTSRVYVHIVNSEMWREITGEEPPRTPVSAKTYSQHGLPWFDLYDENLPTVDPTCTLKHVKSVSEMDEEKFGTELQDDDPVSIGAVKKLLIKMARGAGVRDGDW